MEATRLVEELNRAWRKQRYDDLRRYFHQDVVLTIPGVEPLHGIDAMIDSYRQFGEAAVIHRFDAIEVSVHQHGPIALCRYDFEVDYETAAGRFVERGAEIYAIDERLVPPRVVWRTQVTGPAG